MEINWNFNSGEIKLSAADCKEISIIQHQMRISSTLPCIGSTIKLIDEVYVIESMAYSNNTCDMSLIIKEVK